VNINKEFGIMEESKRRLILHFDLNKTIIMRDEASTINSEEAIVSDIISGMAWGRVEQREKEGEITHVWIRASDKLSYIPQGEKFITYK
jgi:hypothetical protein